MRYFRDAAYLRRAIGAAILFWLLGLWARGWRDDITSHGSYVTSTYDAANNLMHTLWAFAIVALVYVAACLLLTPRTRVAERPGTTSALDANR